MNMQTFVGIRASSGIAIGQAYCYLNTELCVERKIISDSLSETNRLLLAIARASEQLIQIREQATAQVGEEEAAIFDAQKLFLEDTMLLDTTMNNIANSHINAEAAWLDSFDSLAKQFDIMPDELFRARGADIRDVGKRVLRELLGKSNNSQDLIKPSIIVASDLAPSDTVRLDKKLVLAFCTAEGGPTSHTAILAKALGLPAVVGLGSALLEIKAGDSLIVDGERGQVIVDPDSSTCTDLFKRQNEINQQVKVDMQMAERPAQTVDGYRVEVVGNVGSLDDAVSTLDNGGEGIGLLRTEFLYLNSQNAPTEENQLEIYRAVLDVMGDRPVVVRTLDAGGDKNLPFLDLGHEANPFLGWRAIRICLDKPDLFKTQLRALLRASPSHNLRIMFPMVATLDELRRAKDLTSEAHNEVLATGQLVAEEIQIGIMVEIPSVVVLAEHFASEVDFFSIGTNDLTQYTFAAERTNERVAYLGDACHPAILRQIRSVIQIGHNAGIWVGVCGELASDPDAISILLGLGLDEFSVAPPSISTVKGIIRHLSLQNSKVLASNALNLESAEAVRRLVRTQIPSTSDHDDSF
jgi:phosphoenolpyruvate-protein phosphotransferase